MITTFGEIMLRISPENSAERIVQANNYRIEPGGSESNVAIALSNLGMNSCFVSSLPDNQLSNIIIRHLNQNLVNTKYIVINGEKLGTYWTEIGIGSRNSYVIYDRENSSFSNINLNSFNWKEIYQLASWFHFSGISPAVSSSVSEALQIVVNEIECPYSVDLNFREKLWGWVNKDPQQINNVMSKLCAHATLIAGNETDFQNIFGIRSEEKDDDKVFTEIANKCFDKFKNTKYISISNRKSQSATTNNWNGYLFVKDNDQYIFKGVTYNLDNIKDRVGTGDSFVAGIIFGLNNLNNYNFQKIVDFAVALSALNHTTRGDASLFCEAEVLKTMETKGSGRILR